jgi:large subunit ribosomal protein L2
MAKEGALAQVRLPSGEFRYIRMNCNGHHRPGRQSRHSNISIGKAGRKRHMGNPPDGRGSVMNPNDHPHAAARAKAPSAVRPGYPVGQAALGYKTRKTKNRTNKFIVKRRNANKVRRSE